MIYLVDSQYNPNNTEGRLINSRLDLGKGINIATFLGHGAAHINHIRTPAEREQLARNLYIHANFMNMINDNTKFFRNVRVTVSEGIYAAGATETLGGKNILKADGRMVGYQVINRKGKIDHGATFDVAMFWKDNSFYDEIILDYDTYNPDKSLTSTILVQIPLMPKTFDASYLMKISTEYNGSVLSKNEFAEVVAK